MLRSQNYDIINQNWQSKLTKSRNIFKTDKIKLCRTKSKLWQAKIDKIWNGQSKLTKSRNYDILNRNESKFWQSKVEIMTVKNVIFYYDILNWNYDKKSKLLQITSQNWNWHTMSKLWLNIS